MLIKHIKAIVTKSYFVVLIIIFFNCKTKQSNNKTSSLIIKPSTNKIKQEQVDSFSICSNFKKNSFQLYKGLTTDKTIDFTAKLNKQLYYGIKKENFNTLFLGKSIECITPVKSKRFNFFDIQYKQEEMAEKAFSYIKQIDRSNENINKYHDFFKRGLVLILDSKQNKITLITFNPFADNSLPRKIKFFFKQNKHSFEKVCMTTGIGTAEILVD